MNAMTTAQLAAAGQRDRVDPPFPRVLVPVDGSARSESAATPAAALAARCGVPLTFVHLVADDNERAGGFDYLEAAARRLASGVVSDVVVRTAAGELIATEIVGDAAADGALVCMATHGRSRAAQRAGGDRRPGSVAAAVMRLSARPILLVGPVFDARRPVAGGDFVVCLDGSTGAEALLPVAKAWSQALDVPLWVVEVDDGFQDHDPAEYLEAVAGRVMADGWRVLRGPAVADELVALAARHPVGVLAMATRHGADGALGATTLDVIRRSPCPVLLGRSTP